MTSILGCTASCGSSGISGSRKETGLDWKRQKTWQIAGIPPRIYSVYSDLVGFKVILVFFIQVPIVSEIHLYHPRTKEVRLVPVPSIQPPYGCRGIRGGKFTLKFVPILTSIEQGLLRCALKVALVELKRDKHHPVSILSAFDMSVPKKNEKYSEGLEVVTLPELNNNSNDITSSSTSNSPLSSVHSLDVEKKVLEDPIDLEQVELTLPAKLGISSFTRWLYHVAFSYYRKTFTVIFAANLIAFVVFVARNRGAPSAESVGSAASANLMVTLLFRQENFVNLIYELATDIIPLSAPLWLRRRLAKVFHYGGAHSGAGVAAVVWYIMYTALTTKDHIANPTKWSLANMVTSYILVLMFCFILGGAHPTFRRRYHDHFEAVHRYSGWVAVCTFWMHQCFAGNQYRLLQSNPPSLGRYLISTSGFWTFIVSSSCTALSWARLRRVDVYPETLSNHVTRLHFKYRNMKPFYGLKVSSKPLLEWHAFATIPDDDANGKPDGFSIVVSNAGDWTNDVIQNPPKKLWVRGYPLHGLLYTSKLFRKIVVVATGSGIGPPLSLFYADFTPRRIFWSTPAPETTYGSKVIDMVKKADPDAWIWDTRKQGRPDMVAVTYKLVAESGAEAVFIISNPKLTRKVVYGMESRGIPAYGAIFDS